MRRGSVLRLLPCRHLFHAECTAPLYEADNVTCPLCRAVVTNNEEFRRTSYSKTTPRDRELVVECSNRGGDWKSLADSLGVKYQTAYSWIRSGSVEALKRGGAKPRVLSEDHVNILLQWLENDCSLTLVQMKSNLLNEHNVDVSTSSIANYLNNQMYTTKKVHWEPSTMNSLQNKELRKAYIINLNRHVQNGHQIMWIDETNFNLFCRRNCGRSRQGARAIASRPTSRGKRFFQYSFFIHMYART